MTGFCRLCQMLHDPALPAKSYPDLERALVEVSNGTHAAPACRERGSFPWSAASNPGGPVIRRGGGSVRSPGMVVVVAAGVLVVALAVVHGFAKWCWRRTGPRSRPAHSRVL